MKITISESNQIIQFIRRWRRITENHYAPLPDDICTLTRVFIGYLLVAFAFAVGGAFVIFILGFTVVVWIHGAVDFGAFLVASFGTVAWAVIITVSILFAHKRLVDSGYIDPPKAREGPSIGERIADRQEWQLLGEMFRSIKDKTCILVEVRPDQKEES